MIEDVKKYLDEIAEDLTASDDSLENMQTLIDYSKEIGNFPKEAMIKENKVSGCTSNVYLDISVDNNQIIHIQGFSEALVVKGFLSIVLNVIDDQKISEIKNIRKLIEEFIEKSNLSNSLSPSRANAFTNILDHIESRV